MKISKILILLVLFIPFYKTNKTKINEVSGTIIYGFVQNTVPKSEKEKSKELYSFFDKMNEISKDLTFILKFNKNESLFYLNESMESDLNPMAISFVKNIVSRGSQYYNKSEDKILREESIYGSNTLVETVASEINIWKLTGETKKIGSYNCFKATRPKKKIGISSDHTFTIEAWYSPELSMGYGPKEFNGLPGLILELKDTHYTFFAKKIEIKKDTTYEIKSLTSKKIISLEEHNKRMRSAFNKQ